MLLSVTLPWPPRTANGNHQWIRAARGIRQTPEAAAYKELVATLTRQAILNVPYGTFDLDGDITVTLRQYQPNKIRRDVDSNCKIVLDGLARGLRINDSRFSCLIAKLYNEPDRVNPRIEVTVEVATAPQQGRDMSHVQNIVHASEWGQNRSTARQAGKLEGKG